MAQNEIAAKLNNIVPLDRPGFEALGMSAPVLIQMNPEGKWQNTKPEELDEEKLKSVVKHLINSKAVSAAQSYCCQCAAENCQLGGDKSGYVPVIMMPIYPADECPFDMECEVKKIKETETKPSKKGKQSGKVEQAQHDTAKGEKKKSKKRGFVMQRLTDFDLLSQW